MDVLLSALYWLEIIVGLGLLIFIHELGHFILAKRNGVKVEAFSLGMGPILWRRTWGGTEYRISAIPIGGYVKMAGENIGDPRTGAPDELTSKSAWQRLKIFSAGAIMNLVIAFPIAILANLCGRSEHVTTVSVPGHPETMAGMKPGDEILKVGDRPVVSFEQYRKEIVRRPEGMLVPVEVRHADGTVEVLQVKQSGSDRHRTLPRRSTLGRIAPDKEAARLGLKSDDIIDRVDGKPVWGYGQIDDALRGSPGRPVTLAVLRDEGDGVKPYTVTLTPPKKDEQSWPEDWRVAEPVVKAVGANSPADVRVDGEPFFQPGDAIRAIDGRETKSWQDVLDILERSVGKPLKITRERGRDTKTHEIVPTHHERDLWKGQLGVVRGSAPKLVHVAEDSHYYAQGLRSGDVILALELDKNKKGERERTTGEVGAAELWAPRLNKSPFQVDVKRDGQTITLKIAPLTREIGDIEALGLEGYEGHIALGPNQFFRRWTFGAAVVDGLYEPVEITHLTFQLLRKLVVGEEKATGLAGPVGIFDVAYRHAKMSPGNLFWLLALITVNLGIFNLLPIPVLDGGHVLLLAIEKVRGRPPSPRFVERFQLVGVVFLLALIVFVTYNDIYRLFP